jgi:hypothetical protein
MLTAVLIALVAIPIILMAMLAKPLISMKDIKPWQLESTSTSIRVLLIAQEHRVVLSRWWQKQHKSLP